MSFVDKDDGSEIAVEVLVDELNVEHQNIAQTLSSGQFEQLAEFTQDLNAEMEQQEEELATIESEDMHEVIVQDHEIETDIESQTIEIKTQKSAIPPLRPLTIAPKPAKLPITFKPMAGQQLLLVQGGAPGQQLKLVSQTSGINISNLTISKPITLKSQAPKTITTTMPTVQPKQLLMKKVVTQFPKNNLGKVIDTKPGQIMVVQKSEPQQIKLIPTSGGTPITSTPAKTLTLAQAQQMGIISGTKIIPQAGTKQLILNKSPTKTFKLVPQARSPTKILPAPQPQIQNVQPAKITQPQRIFLKPTSTAPTTVMPTLLEVAGGINTGQLHQINIPGKGLQYIKFVTTSQPQATTSTVNLVQTTKPTSKVVPITTMANAKAGNIILSELKTTQKPMSFQQKITKPLTPTIRPMNVTLAQSTSGNQVFVLPATYVSKPQTTIPTATNTSKVATTPVMRLATSPTKAKSQGSSSGDAVVPSLPQSKDSESTPMEPNGLRPRKPCNCTKSQCLKLYCECFANGEFCYMCNCMHCSNNLENEEFRQKAIRNCLERNPNAFRPKIGKGKDSGDVPIRKHTKGCNCKRSGCLKNYCECYEAKIACSSNCKCMGCRNVEDAMDKKNVRAATLTESKFTVIASRVPVEDNTFNTKTKRTSYVKQPFNFITNDVIEATSQCLLTLASNAEECVQDEELTKKQLIEEFGRCLKQIINCSIMKNNTKVN